MGADSEIRRRLYEWEDALDRKWVDEYRREPWGSAHLSPSLPLVWDMSSISIERQGLELEAVIALADEVLGGAGFEHRTIAIVDEADGERLARAAEALDGWETEPIRYMIWREGAATEASGDVSVIETTLDDILELRREINAENLPPGAPEPERTVEQLLELDRRLGAAAGDRWFAAPADGPASCCRLLSEGGTIGQVEDVGTLAGARNRGLAKATVGAAVAASREREDEITFLSADGADWPQLLYGRLGFETVGDLHILRRPPPGVRA